MAETYCPERGDIIWLSFNPQLGHEQAGRCPALTLSPSPYNRKVGLVLVCPVTTNIKRYPFEVQLPDELKISGAILSDQIKSFDWKTRKAEYICKVPTDIIEDVLAKIATLLT